MPNFKLTPHQRQEILRSAQATGNVQQTCDRAGISRALFYRWATRYKKEGLAGLRDKSSGDKTHPRKISADVEMRVELLVRDQPSLGCRGVASILRSQGVNASFKTVQRVLDRRNLGRAERWMMLEEQFRTRPETLNRAQMKFLIGCNPRVSQHSLRPTSSGIRLAAGRFTLPRRCGLPRCGFVAVIDMYSGYAVADSYRAADDALRNLLSFFRYKLDRSPELLIMDEQLANRLEQLPLSSKRKRIDVERVTFPSVGYISAFQQWLEHKFINESKPRPWMEPNDALIHWVEYHNFYQAPETFPNYGRTPFDLLWQCKQGCDTPSDLSFRLERLR